ncbi:MAG: aldo/keto reductase [Verrucomicrobiota bacterium]
MKIIAVLQPRVFSQRLLATSLLPVAGMPLVVLSARRAANRGLAVRALASNDRTHDVLDRLFRAHGVDCVRSPLDDVLQQFVLATECLNTGDLVVRIISDNTFPDGEFIQELVEQFQEGGAGYLGTHSPLDGLPCGVSAEVFTVDLLREANRDATANADREHVTSWIRRQTGAPCFGPILNKDLSHLRCTVETVDDYQRILRVFEKETEPIGVSWRTLCQRLEEEHDAHFRIPYKLKNGRVLSRMTLGTAQLGLDQYGIANTSGRPAEPAAIELIRRAVSHGVTVVDTARAYGCAEARVGRAFAELPTDAALIITKHDPLPWLPPSLSTDAIQAAVERSVYCSCHRLRRQSLDILMLHRAEHYRLFNGAIWRTLLECRDRGLVRELGVSVYSPAEALEVLQSSDVLHLQVPLNILDRRWDEASVPEALASRPEVTVYARSAFLQGALLLPSGQWPRVAQPLAQTWCAQLDQLVADFKRQNRADLCLAYVLAQPWVDSVVLGLENLAQLDANLQLIRQPALSIEQVCVVEATFRGVAEEVLNPAKWESAKVRP